MSQQLINQYLAEIDRLRKFSGLSNEQVIRRAFGRLLESWATSRKLVFLEEYPVETTMKTTVRPDGTVLHDIRVPHGYWEAKDTKDDLDEEIRKKFARGYPQDNIVFENSETAVLIQNRQEVMRASMTDTGELLRLVARFFDYERPEIEEFRKAVEKFKADMPTVLEALRERIETAYRENAAFRAEAARFLETCKETINPTLGEADVREMLIQHILTEEIFTHVFNEGDFQPREQHRQGALRAGRKILHRCSEARDVEGAGALLRGDPGERGADHQPFGKADLSEGDLREFLQGLRQEEGRPARRRLHAERDRQVHDRRRRLALREAFRPQPRRRACGNPRPGDGHRHLHLRTLGIFPRRPEKARP